MAPGADPSGRRAGDAMGVGAACGLQRLAYRVAGARIACLNVRCGRDWTPRVSTGSSRTGPCRRTCEHCRPRAMARAARPPISRGTRPVPRRRIVRWVIFATPNRSGSHKCTARQSAMPAIGERNLRPPTPRFRAPPASPAPF